MGPVQAERWARVAPAQGSGLSGLADRISALGGTLEIESPVGVGTTVRARIAVTAGADRVFRGGVRGREAALANLGGRGAFQDVR